MEVLSAPAWEEDISPSPTERRVDLSTANLDVSEDETLMLPGRSTAAAPGGGTAPTTPIPAAPQPTVPALSLQGHAVTRLISQRR